jgi:hypothetical protein
MTSKNVRRVVSTRRLTTDEAAEARRLRDAVEKDKAEIVAEGHRMLARRGAGTSPPSKAPRRSARVA